MEPRARAGKNVGKMNFSHQELTQFLIAHGDSRQPLHETMRVLDEILTEFIQGVSFEAARVAQLSGRQKVKYEDFQFAMRKNPLYLGKAAENKELREALDKQRKAFDETEYTKEDASEPEDAAGASSSRAGAAGAAAGAGKNKKRTHAGAAVAGAGAAATTNGASSSLSVNGSGKVNGSGGALDDEELGDADDEEIDELVGPNFGKA